MTASLGVRIIEVVPESISPILDVLLLVLLIDIESKVALNASMYMLSITTSQ